MHIAKHIAKLTIVFSSYSRVLSMCAIKLGPTALKLMCFVKFLRTFFEIPKKSHTLTLHHFG